MTQLLLTPDLQAALELGMKAEYPIYILGRGDCPAELQDLKGYILEPMTANSILGPLTSQIAQAFYALPGIKGMAVLHCTKTPTTTELEPFYQWEDNADNWIMDRIVPTYIPRVNTLVAILGDWTWAAIDEWPGHRATWGEETGKAMEVMVPIAFALVLGAVGAVLSGIGGDSHRRG